MSKADELTEEDLKKFPIKKKLLRRIEEYRLKHNLEKKDMNILDWGCGRGNTVLLLRDEGYNAFGVDIQASFIANSKKIFFNHNYDHGAILSLIDTAGRTIFKDKYFHFIFSLVVFEHIEYLDIVAKEFKRITGDYGVSFHYFPAHKGIVERHFDMPFLHWFPKNRIRYYVIMFYLWLGVGRYGEENNKRGVYTNAEKNYQYIINRTFYRSTHTIKDIFKKSGLKAEFKTVSDEDLKTKSPFIYFLTRIRLIRKLFDFVYITFYRVELMITRF